MPLKYIKRICDSGQTAFIILHMKGTVPETAEISLGLPFSEISKPQRGCWENYDKFRQIYIWGKIALSHGYEVMFRIMLFADLQ